MTERTSVAHIYNRLDRAAAHGSGSMRQRQLEATIATAEAMLAIHKELADPWLVTSVAHAALTAAADAVKKAIEAMPAVREAPDEAQRAVESAEQTAKMPDEVQRVVESARRAARVVGARNQHLEAQAEKLKAENRRLVEKVVELRRLDSAERTAKTADVVQGPIPGDAWRKAKMDDMQEAAEAFRSQAVSLRKENRELRDTVAKLREEQAELLSCRTLDSWLPLEAQVKRTLSRPDAAGTIDRLAAQVADDLHDSGFRKVI